MGVIAVVTDDQVGGCGQDGMQGCSETLLFLQNVLRWICVPPVCGAVKPV